MVRGRRPNLLIRCGCIANCCCGSGRWWARLSEQQLSELRCRCIRQRQRSARGSRRHSRERGRQEACRSRARATTCHPLWNTQMCRPGTACLHGATSNHTGHRLMSPVQVCVSTGMLDGRVPANAAGALRRCCVSSYRDDHIVPGPGARLKR